MFFPLLTQEIAGLLEGGSCTRQAIGCRQFGFNLFGCLQCCVRRGIKRKEFCHLVCSQLLIVSADEMFTFMWYFVALDTSYGA